MNSACGSLSQGVEGIVPFKNQQSAFMTDVIERREKVPLLKIKWKGDQAQESTGKDGLGDKSTVSS